MMIIFLLILDRLTKWYFLKNHHFYASQLIKLQLSKNQGLYFFAFNQTLLKFITSIILLFLFFLFIKYWRKKDYFLANSLFLIILGGLSNLFDRLVFGFVIDWLWLGILPISVFNFADVMILMGTLFIILRKL